MCIRDRAEPVVELAADSTGAGMVFARTPSMLYRADTQGMGCLLYTSDAADERSSVDLGGRRIIKKKTNT